MKMEKEEEKEKTACSKLLSEVLLQEFHALIDKTLQKHTALKQQMNSTQASEVGEICEEKNKKRGQKRFL